MLLFDDDREAARGQPCCQRGRAPALVVHLDHELGDPLPVGLGDPRQDVELHAIENDFFGGNIGVAGLSANSAALSATSSNIANVNTVGYKDETANFETFLNSPGLVGNASAGVAAVISQDVTTQGLPTQTSSPTDLSISGNGFFVVNTNTSSTATQEYTRAGSFTPDASGNLVNSAGLYLMGYKLDSSGNAPADTSDLSLINIDSLSGSASPTTKISMQANLESDSTVDSSYTAGDMAAGNVTPDFTHTVDVYDTQGGQQPITFSFIKTAANSWAYEASYAGASSNLSSANPIAEGTMTFNADGTLANVNGAKFSGADMGVAILREAGRNVGMMVLNFDQRQWASLRQFASEF